LDWEILIIPLPKGLLYDDFFILERERCWFSRERFAIGYNFGQYREFIDIWI